MTSSAASASAPAPGSPRGLLACLVAPLGMIGVGCLAVITLAHPGATRMYAWPWSLAYTGALLAPVLALLLRAFDSRQPLVLPSGLWCLPVAASAATILASALASPFRGPSLLWSIPLLAGLAVFLVVYDALASVPHRAARFHLVVGLGFAAVVLTNMAFWLPTVPQNSLQSLLVLRNGYPLGHSSYTAAIVVLGLPWLVVLAVRTGGRVRLAWSFIVLLAFVMFVSSSSRGGMLGLGAAAFTALLLAPLPRKRKLAVTAGLVLAGLALVVAHPRTRAMLAPADPAAPPNISNVQRSAMLNAAARMGVDRPLLGWGPGTTPLAYPSYRAGLDGGVETALQLHSTPAQLWAELGGAGLLCGLLALGAFFLTARTTARDIARAAGTLPKQDLFALAAVSALAGYLVFSLTDWQLDIPVFGFLLALLAACLAASAHRAPRAPSHRTSRIIGMVTLLVFAVTALLGRRDPTPELNVRALALARGPAHTRDAVALLQSSLALNPDQEIAHFNLGWLLVVPEPAAAEKHFLDAAHLVPDKGGVYFGLGLARLNQNRPAGAARAFALECLNEPLFLSSPWWSEPALAALRGATAAEFVFLTARVRKSLPNPSWAATQLAHLSTLTPAAVPGTRERTYRRERTAYPVLARNLDLPSPTDLYDVREVAPAPSSLPPKGWLPSPLLLELLDAPLAPSENLKSPVENRK